MYFDISANIRGTRLMKLTLSLICCLSKASSNQIVNESLAGGILDAIEKYIYYQLTVERIIVNQSNKKLNTEKRKTLNPSDKNIVP